ncbi:DNA polymerase III subunit alpha [Cryomorphaceae bacterium]|nr:DNA polymerase III subunit alpha [Cryomorphaceae bacterium]
MLLNNHSYYSLKYGTMSEQELLEQAQIHGYRTLALTDINNTSAALNFVRIAHRYGVRPVLGIDVRRGSDQLFVALAHDNDGWFELNRFLSPYLVHETELELPDRAPAFEHVSIIYPLAKAPRRLRPNEYVGVHARELTKLPFSPFAKRRDKLVALHTATFRNKRDYNAHRLLRAIDKNTLLSKLPKAEEGHPDDRFLDKQQLRAAYKGHEYLLEKAEGLLERCSISFSFGINNNLKRLAKTAEEDFAKLRKLTYEGVKYRYKNPDDDLFDRIQMELDIIQQKDYTSYFLISWDLIHYAKSKGYFHVGRGSGANSVVAYCLGITDVDPIELNLYFERFINLYRENPPDFDLDFSWTDRDDVTHYLFNKYGKERTTLLATYITFQFKSVLRELGKVFGLPKHEIDSLQQKVKYRGRLDEIEQLVLRYSQYIQGFPSHLSVHAGGILISERPMHYYTTTYVPPKGFETTHFDMVIAEDVGLYKFDILSQRGLGHIRDTLDEVERNRGVTLDIHDIPAFKKDPAIKELLRVGRTMGCFYVESPAMRQLLHKLGTDDYSGLVAASSIIRPGVSQSGMMREYILRHRYPEKRKEAHPIMQEIMPDTYGVMVYQEDVIKVAHYFAGLTLGEADVLRRGMSGKYRSREEFSRARDKFFSNCREKGYSDELTSEVWRQTESFAGYAFAKGHSASYAVESYQSLFLKAHYPLEFMVGVINNFGGFYRTEFYVHEARMGGAEICAPCVNRSQHATTIYDRSLFLGFQHMKSLEQRVIRQLLAERSMGGAYRDLEDFLKRISISLEQLRLLVRVGAFRFTGKTKKELLWEAHMHLSKGKSKPRKQELFEIRQKKYDLPPLNGRDREDAFDEMEIIGFPLVAPYELLEEPVKNKLGAVHLKEALGQHVEVYGYLVTIKDTKTKSGKRMHFGTWIDQDGLFVDSVHFPPQAEKKPFRGRGIYRIRGKVIEEFGCYAIDCDDLEKLPYIEDPRYA